MYSSNLFISHCSFTTITKQPMIFLIIILTFLSRSCGDAGDDDDDDDDDVKTAKL